MSSSNSTCSITVFSTSIITVNFQSAIITVSFGPALTTHAVRLTTGFGSFNSSKTYAGNGVRFLSRTQDTHRYVRSASFVRNKYPLDCVNDKS